MHKWLILAVIVPIAAAAVADTPAPEKKAPVNPLLAEWKTPFHLPPFGDIRTEHFLPALEAGMSEQRREVDAIAGAREAATFANTIEALERSGLLLAKVDAVFSNLRSAETSDALQEVAKQAVPKLSAHEDDILMNAELFRRVKAVWEARAGLGLGAEQARLLEDTWKTFVRGGAQLDAAGQARLRAINAELSGLSLQFGDNLLAETNAYRLVIDKKEDLAGLPERVVAGAAEAAAKAGLQGRWVFSLHAPSLWPFLDNADDRELRRRIFEAYTTRGQRGGETDNRKILAHIAALRAERAKLLGYATHADFVLEENMARTPARVRELIDRLWPAAKAVAAREAEALQARIAADGHDFRLAPHDWFYYAEKVRRERYALDEQALRPYFKLDSVRDGVFWLANKLYGISFSPLAGVPLYHPEVQAYEVKDADGSHLAVFLADFHPRPGKRSGAWASRYRPTWVEDGRSIRPIVVNVCNFSRPAGDEPALLTLEETETLFHEFGHALHSILSRVSYRSLASVPRDFVEMPSQIMENWALEPEVLAVYAKHWKTGEPIPESLVKKIKDARRFNQGFRTVEYLAASLLDLEWHTLADTKEREPASFEAETLARIAMPAEIVPRYRSTYFQHVFSGGYSAGYYSYIWSEVLDADAYEAFKEKGIFDPATARSFRTNILEKGNSEDPMTLYVRFRGKEPSVEPLLERRGLEP